MHRAAVVPLIALLCWPLPSQASEFDLPELGVRLTNLPSAVAKPQVSEATEHPGGYEAVMRLGTAELNIHREEAPVPAGSDVAEPAYRAQLDRRYQGGVESKTHSAWTVVDAHSGSSELMHYTCLTYVIVDQHLYRLAVTANGSPGRPPEFDALVKALSGITFEPVQRTTHS